MRRFRDPTKKRAPTPASPPDESSEWRRRARRLFRALHRDLDPVLQNEDCSIYGVFRELLPLCIRAHEQGNAKDLRAIYDFAHWCWDTNVEAGEDLGNAAGVAFLEHLGHSEAVRTQITERLRPDLSEGIHEWWGWQEQA